MYDFVQIKPSEIKNELGLLSFPWWIASGWAIELFVNRPIRDHHDIDIAILRSDHLQLWAELPYWEFYIAKDGVLSKWQGDRLSVDVHALWARKKGEEIWLCEFLINESSETDWIFRKDRAITCPLETIGLISPEGIPYLRPAIPLLFKSVHSLDKDNIDFNAALPHLSVEEKQLLRTWISHFNSVCTWQCDLQEEG